MEFYNFLGENAQENRITVPFFYYGQQDNCGFSRIRTHPGRAYLRGYSIQNAG